MATETVLRSSGVTTTILGVLNQFHAFTNLVYPEMHETTLNYKYNVLINGYESPKYAPTLKYFGIGTRGYQNIDLQQSALPYPGDARCMDLYGPLPIRCVRLTDLDDVLPLQERAKYRMMQIKNVDGVDYACFYLKLIEFNSVPHILKKNADGTTEEYPLSPDTWLSPVPPDLNQIGGSINTNINRIIVRVTGTCRIDHDEIMEAVKVLHSGDMDYARISEIGYYTGYDVRYYTDGTPGQIHDLDDLPDGGASIDENIIRYEAAYVQLAKHHCFRGSELYTQGSYIAPLVSLESECCINGY